MSFVQGAYEPLNQRAGFERDPEPLEFTVLELPIHRADHRHHWSKEREELIMSMVRLVLTLFHIEP